MTGIEGNLAAEIATTDGEVTALQASVDSLENKGVADLAEINSSVDSLEGVDAGLRTDVDAAQSSIDAMLAGSSLDLDNLKEITDYIDSIDAFDDNFLVGKLASMDTRDANLEGSVDSLEIALEGEISATNSEVVRLDGRVASVDVRVAAEEVARLAGDTYQEEAVTGMSFPANAPATVVTVGSFAFGANNDMEVYVNGVRVAFTQIDPQNVELNLAYEIEASDIVRVVGVKG